MFRCLHSLDTLRHQACLVLASNFDLNKNNTYTDSERDTDFQTMSLITSFLPQFPRSYIFLRYNEYKTKKILLPCSVWCDALADSNFKQ
jgi:hypothetical protein